jgi:hypothetical protein
MKVSAVVIPAAFQGLQSSTTRMSPAIPPGSQAEW